MDTETERAVAEFRRACADLKQAIIESLAPVLEPIVRLVAKLFKDS